MFVDAGHTYVPDITVVTPIFDDAGKEKILYIASRGHHRDIGGLRGIKATPLPLHESKEVL